MDYGGVDKRRTKKDLRRKRLARGYKRGGKFRSAEVSEASEKKNKRRGEKKSNIKEISDFSSNREGRRKK